MEAIPSYDELCRLEPRIREVEAEVRAVKDDPMKSFFCSNFVWLPLNAELRSLIGVSRTPQGGDRDQPVLFDSWAYEKAYDVLSVLLPPCRDCGCRAFQPVRDAQVASHVGRHPE